MAKFEVNDYYELIALYRALMAAKFARDQIIPELPGSPFIANMFNRLADALNEMEVERGKPERAEWHMEIRPEGERWGIALRDASSVRKETWDQWSEEERENWARIHLAPFSLTDDLIGVFIAQVNEHVNTRNQK